MKTIMVTPIFLGFFSQWHRSEPQLQFDSRSSEVENVNEAKSEREEQTLYTWGVFPLNDRGSWA